jgi:hypothetical protein
VCDFDDASLTRVYSAIVEWWGDRAQLSSEVMGKASTLVKATLEIYNTIKKELLPTPAKSHYTYNMRDISKVWQGVSMVGAPPKDVPELVRLWAHENLRVFHDRLVNDEDRLWFFDFIRKMVDKHSGLKFDKVFAHLDADENGIIDIVELRKLMFADFVEGDQAYAEVLDVPNLLSVVEEQLVDYNQQSKTRMDLVLFLYAAEHICRISRVIRQDLGNALLVGVGGSGRQSLTRIAAYMSEYAVYSIAISKSYGVFEWHEDLKSVLRKAGGEGKPTVFLFNDTQIKLESFLEDINNILNTGEVPNLFAKDETAQVCDMVAVRAKKAGAPDGTMAELFQYFVPRELAHGAVHVPRRRRVPRAPSEVPVARQLLHDRLVQRVAVRRAAVGRVAVSQRRRDGKRRDARRVHRDLSDDAPVRAHARGKIPLRSRPLLLRHPDVVPRAHRDVQDVTRGETLVRERVAEPLRERSRANFRRGGPGRRHERRAHRARPRARTHAGRDRRDPRHRRRGDGRGE